MKQIQKGFTLIELMIVVAIIGILAAVAIPAYQDYVTKAKLSKVTSVLDPLKLALSQYYQENGSFPSAAISTTNRAGGAAVTTGSVWDSIGLTSLPVVPIELASIGFDGTVSPAKLTLTFNTQGIGVGVDTKVLEQDATVGGTGITWDCNKTSGTTLTSVVAKKYYGC